MKAYKYEVTMKDDTRIALLEQSIGHVNEALIRIEKRFDRVESKLESLEIGINESHKNSWSQFRWIIGIIFTSFGIAVTIFIKGHS